VRYSPHVALARQMELFVQADSELWMGQGTQSALEPHARQRTMVFAARRKYRGKLPAPTSRAPASTRITWELMSFVLEAYAMKLHAARQWLQLKRH
jgi:hypothetical protein